jgi:RNA polymerase sigma-70 factor (ECF subfamily)
MFSRHFVPRRAPSAPFLTRSDHWPPPPGTIAPVLAVLECPETFPTNFLTAPVYFSQDAEDAALVAQTLQADAAAFEVLVKRYERVLYTVAFRMLGNRDDAKDATQTAFVRAYERLATFNPDQRFFSWIYRIAINECLNLIRARRPEEAITPAFAAAGSPFETAVSRQRRTQVQAAILQLSPDYRAVVVLRHFAGLSYDEMAAALGIPAKTVKSRLHTARQRLGEALLGWRTA